MHQRVPHRGGAGRSRSRPPSIALCPAVAVLLGAGCKTDASAPDKAASAVFDSAGVELVVNTGPGWNADNAWWLELDLQAGDLDGPLAFGQVRWVGPGFDGGMLVLDGQTGLVHAFDSEGNHLREFGGLGDGPGEFRRPASVVAVSGGRVAVTEGYPPSLHWLRADGTYLGTLRLREATLSDGTPAAGSFAGWQVTPTGVPYAQVMAFGAPGQADGTMPVVLLRLGNTAGGAPDTMLSWTWTPGFRAREVRVFEPQTTWAPKADGAFVVSEGGAYEIREHDPEGRLIRIIRRSIEPVPVTPAHREGAMDGMRAEAADGGAPPEVVDRLLDRAVFEKNLPQVWRVWASEPDGRVWAGVYDPGARSEGRGPGEPGINAWDVFESDGRFLGRLAAPDGFRLTAVAENAVYGVVEGVLDVPSARRYRIERPETGLRLRGQSGS